MLLQGWIKSPVAVDARVNVNTIRAMEARGPAVLTSGLDTVRRVQAVLEAAGVQFIPENGGGPAFEAAQGKLLSKNKP